MRRTDSEDIRKTVRATYDMIAKTRASCCGPEESSGCATRPKSGALASRHLGYSDTDFTAVPEGSYRGLGCGNPTALASLNPGETVLDLGSGAGFDCFLAASRVGPTGHVIGVDMTSEMVEQARRHAGGAESSNVEFRLGEIEHLPVADGTIDVIISNCVINLSPDKPAVFRDAFRVLKSGGRLAVSNMVATAPLPEALSKDPAMVSGCIGGAAGVDEIRGWLDQAGFHHIHVAIKEASRVSIDELGPDHGVGQYVASATIEATKP